jgi:uncharacterized protein DUF4167
MHSIRRSSRPPPRGGPGGARQGRPPADRRAARDDARRNNATGNAAAKYARYVALARDAASRGDRIEAENWYQHAEHYFRVMQERAA